MRAHVGCIGWEASCKQTSLLLAAHRRPTSRRHSMPRRIIVRIVKIAFVHKQPPLQRCATLHIGRSGHDVLHLAERKSDGGSGKATTRYFEACGGQSSGDCGQNTSLGILALL